LGSLKKNPMNKRGSDEFKATAKRNLLAASRILLSNKRPPTQLGLAYVLGCIRRLVRTLLGESYMKDYSEYETQRNILIEYMHVMIARCDWHGVSDVANDLRVLEAEEKNNG